MERGMRGSGGRRRRRIGSGQGVVDGSGLALFLEFGSLSVGKRFFGVLRSVEGGSGGRRRRSKVGTGLHWRRALLLLLLGGVRECRCEQGHARRLNVAHVGRRGCVAHDIR